MTGSREEGTGRAAACPGAEALAALAVGEGDAAVRLALADHVGACASCAADFRLLRELHAEASPRARPSRRAWLVGAAAAAVAAVALTPLLLRDRDDRVRGQGAQTRPADGERLGEPPETLAWPAQPGATGYRVKLFRGDASPLWESEATAPVATLPPEVREGLRTGGSWYWTVEALGPVQRRRLGPFWFELRPP
jgi:hypothetical protein